MQTIRFNVNTLLAALVAISGALGGCGDVEADQPIERVQRALGTFGAWAPVPNGTFRPGGPALAYPGLGSESPTGVTAFGWANDQPTGLIYSNHLRMPHGWFSAWSSPSILDSVAVATPPAAVGIDNLNGRLHAAFALAAADSGGRFFVSVFDGLNLSFFRPWNMIPNGLFIGQPAIAITHGKAAQGPRGTFFLAGKGLDDRIWVATNALESNSFYNSGAWSGFFPIPNGTFKTSPAVTWACPREAWQPVMMITAIGFDDRLYVSKLVGSTWSGWTAIPNGTFLAKTPAMATICGNGGIVIETLVFALGMDSRIYFDRDHGTGTFDGRFTPIGSQTFTDGPGAVAAYPDVEANLGVVVAARVDSGEFFWTNAIAD